MLFFIFVRFAAALVQSTTFAVVFPFDEESSWYPSGRVPFIYQFFYLRKCKWLGIKDNASYDCRNAKLGFSSRLSFCRCRPITRVTSKIGLYQLTYHEMIVRTCDDKTRKSDTGQICLSYEEVTKGKLGVWKLKKLGIVNPVERRHTPWKYFLWREIQCRYAISQSFCGNSTIFNLFSKIKPKFWK